MPLILTRLIKLLTLLLGLIGWTLKAITLVCIIIILVATGLGLFIKIK